MCVCVRVCAVTTTAITATAQSMGIMDIITATTVTMATALSMGTSKHACPHALDDDSLPQIPCQPRLIPRCSRSLFYICISAATTATTAITAIMATALSTMGTSKH